MQILDGTRYPSVGKCIYCGSTDDLTDEHVVPLGLSGTAVLPDASCTECAKITGKFEQHVLRGPMQQVRVFRDLKSRTKHRDAPQAKEFQVSNANAEAETVTVGFAESPVVFSFPVFDVPAFLKPDGYTKGIRMTGIATCAFGVRPEESLKQFDAQTLSWQENHRYDSFARMIAKIGYANAVGQALALGVKEPFPQLPAVASSILGKTEDIGLWVGTLSKPPESHFGILHRVNLSTLTGQDEILVAEVQIFADSESPSYGVILGKSNFKL